VTFTGTVGPSDVGASVTLQRESRPEVWNPVGDGQVDSEGKYSVVHTFSRPGEAHLRVVLHCHGLCMTSASAPVSYRIASRRSKPITIQASANPLAYGLSVTITGTVAGAAGQQVKLLAQTGTGGAFAPIAEGVTVGDEYTFTESPLQSTRYRVSSTRASSAVLSESVGYALTATPPPSSVQVGEQLTLTGTAVPAHEGQPVALERRNASGLGYHPIAAGVISSLSAYTITYKFPASGEEELRIRVAGNSDIHGATSEVFKLEVTPAG
jgi:hypothetical protein